MTVGKELYLYPIQKMKKHPILSFTLAILIAISCACSPYRVHNNAPPRMAHKAYKAPISFLNFQARSGCGCH